MVSVQLGREAVIDSLARLVEIPDLIKFRLVIVTRDEEEDTQVAVAAARLELHHALAQLNLQLLSCLPQPHRLPPPCVAHCHCILCCHMVEQTCRSGGETLAVLEKVMLRESKLAWRAYPFQHPL